MGLLQECPKCRARLGLEKWVKLREGEGIQRRKERVDVCECGFKLNKAAGKVYWIEYYILGQRKRERIGPNKAAAEQRLREALKLRAEERYIDKDPAARLTLGELCAWYLKLPEVKAKDSYGRDLDFIRHLKRLLGENTKIKNLTPGRLESYQQQRLQEKSPRRIQGKSPRAKEVKASPEPGNGEKVLKLEKANTSPAEINRETACLKTILNRAVRHGKLQHNPLSNLKRLPENNVRMRILTPDEFERLVQVCPDYLRPVVLMAYHMGLRRSEILELIWPEVDLKKGFIRLPPERTKIDQARVIPIHPMVKAILAGLPRGLYTDRVFLQNGIPFDDFKKSFRSACDKAGILDFTFHDFRHCALNNLRLAGNDYFKIMAISGHRTLSCFKRYNLVTEEELTRIKWSSTGIIPGSMDTYMDTKQKGVAAESMQPLDIAGRR
jgi:integrase